MNKNTPSLLALIVLTTLFWPVQEDALAQSRTTTYTGFINSHSIKLTIRWTNYSGLGPVSGSYTWAGNVYTFTGNNYAPGKLELTDSAGDTWYLAKSNSSNTIGWQGSSPTWGGANVTFTRPK